jgi:drug/metabolite transporter (DMT)-like permease
MTTAPQSSANDSPEPAWLSAMPALFVLLWSTGFIGAKWGLPYAEPFTFLAIRFAIASCLFGLIAVLSGARWPKTVREFRDAIVVGILINGAYLGGVFWAISQGTSAGLAAIVTGMQPLFTAALALPFLGERLNRLQWAGLFVGFAGIVLVLWKGANAGPLLGIGGAVVALVGITLGTFYQKRFGGGNDIRTASCIQQAAAAGVVTVLAFSLETRTVNWTGDFVFALSWLVIVLSLGTFSLYYMLIRRGAVSKVSSLFYLVPPVVALDAWFLFGETLEGRQIAGMVLAAVGVALVTRPPKVTK